MNADIARSWILANGISLIVSAVLHLAGYGLREILGANVAGAALSAQAIYVLAEVAISAFSMALFARLSGAVMVHLVPALPHVRWMALHVTLGILGGLSFGLLGLANEGKSGSFGDLDDIPFSIFMVCFFAGGGALIGAVFGGLQVLALRPAVKGLGLWVVCSMGAMCILAMILLIAAFSIAPSVQGFAAELLMAGAVFAGSIVGAIIMLPAVLRLRPDNSTRQP